MSTEKAVEPQVQDTPEDTFDDLSDKAKAEFKSLRSENASRRVENKELKEKVAELESIKSKFDEAEKAKLEEEGKYKEILEKTENEKAELEKKAKKVEEYETLLTKQLEANMEGLSEENVAFINNLDLPLVKKIEMANKLKGVQTPPADSPAPARPGGVTETATKMFDKIDSEPDIYKRSQMLNDLKKQNIELYKKYLNTGG